MKLVINIEKRHFRIIIIILFITIAIITVNAFGSNNPSVMGHSWGEISEFPQACPAGQVVQGIGPSLTCISGMSDTRCDTPGINCNLDSNDIPANTITSSDISDGTIATVDLGDGIVTSAKTDATICKSDGTNCKGYTIQVRKITPYGGCDYPGDSTSRSGNCATDCVTKGFGQCLFSQHPNCALAPCGTHQYEEQHTCVCLKVV